MSSERVTATYTDAVELSESEAAVMRANPNAQVLVSSGTKIVSKSWNEINGNVVIASKDTRPSDRPSTLLPSIISFTPAERTRLGGLPAEVVASKGRPADDGLFPSVLQLGPAERRAVEAKEALNQTQATLAGPQGNDRAAFSRGREDDLLPSVISLTPQERASIAKRRHR